MICLQLNTQICKIERSKICLNDYKYILEKYTGEDWKEFIQLNPYNYSRCKVYDDPMFDIHIITWYNLQSSPIHNHANNGCLSKILTGDLTELIYNPDDLRKPIQFNHHKLNKISYIDNKIGYHKIKNNDDITVSLHIYSPPKFKTKYFK